MVLIELLLMVTLQTKLVLILLQFWQIITMFHFIQLLHCRLLTFLGKIKIKIIKIKNKNIKNIKNIKIKYNIEIVKVVLISKLNKENHLKFKEYQEVLEILGKIKNNLLNLKLKLNILINFKMGSH